MRLPGLDGIRAISICLVLLFHVATSAAGYRVLEFGGFGVEIFFVVSGFLITWLLCCEEAKHSSISLQAFYARRALRILPPAVTYLALLVVLASAGLIAVSRADVLGCLLFARNVLPGSALTAHFWSLSIEEQFYLFWPLLMIVLGSNKARLRFCIALLMISPVWHIAALRIAGGAAYLNHARFDQQCDALLVGCCLALMRNDSRLLAYLRNSWFQARWVPWAAVGSLIVLVPLPHAERIAYWFIALFINYAVEHDGGPLNWGPVAWIGKLSYSLYIWQQLFCWYSPFQLGHFPANLAATFAAASLSYYLIEQPFARLRKRVQFVPVPAWLLRFQLRPEPVISE